VVRRTFGTALVRKSHDLVLFTELMGHARLETSAPGGIRVRCALLPRVRSNQRGGCPRAAKVTTAAKSLGKPPDDLDDRGEIQYGDRGLADLV
jgi:hypothetical protein